jgi:hypothetical protein
MSEKGNRGMPLQAQERGIPPMPEGDGYPAAISHEQPLLFEKFVRLSRDLSGDIRGTGLGLYISRQLVERMNGHIWVESSGQAGKGSTFCFLLPQATHLLSSARPMSSFRLVKQGQKPGFPRAISCMLFFIHQYVTSTNTALFQKQINFSPSPVFHPYGLIFMFATNRNGWT